MSFPGRLVQIGTFLQDTSLSVGCNFSDWNCFFLKLFWPLTVKPSWNARRPKSAACCLVREVYASCLNWNDLFYLNLLCCRSSGSYLCLPVTALPHAIFHRSLYKSNSLHVSALGIYEPSCSSDHTAVQSCWCFERFCPDRKKLFQWLVHTK